MSKALSVDLRMRVFAAVDGGASHREAAERFGVSAASVSRWRNLQIRQGNVRLGPLGGDLMGDLPALPMALRTARLESSTRCQQSAT